LSSNKWFYSSNKWFIFIFSCRREEKLEKKKKLRNMKFKKYALIGMATVGGGALVGLTGGLAAPLIGAGVGTLLGGAGAAAAISSTAGMAVVGSMFGVAGAGLTGKARFGWHHGLAGSANIARLPHQLRHRARGGFLARNFPRAASLEEKWRRSYRK
jgi:hypothetical protein